MTFDPDGARLAVARRYDFATWGRWFLIDDFVLPFERAWRRLAIGSGYLADDVGRRFVPGAFAVETCNTLRSAVHAGKTLHDVAATPGFPASSRHLYASHPLPVQKQ